MARTVTPTITAALNSTIAAPSISAVITDPFDRPHAAISNSNAGRSAITQFGSAWIRAYVNQPGLGSNATVYSQLITDPTNATQLNTYNSRSTTAAGQAGVALAMFGATIYLLYQRQSDNHICFQTSTDGIGWSAETVASSTTVRAWALASAGNNDLFIAQDVTPGQDQSQNIILLTLSGATWSVTATWTNPAVQINGMQALYAAGTYRLVAGAQSRSAGALALCTLTYNGSSWSPVTPIHPLDDPLTGISSPYPSLNLINGLCRIASTVYDSGSASGISGNRTELWTSPDFLHWYLEQLVGTSFTNGANIVTGQGGNGWVLADAGTLLRSEQSDSAGNPPIDVSDRVFTLHIKEPANDKTTAVATIDNSDQALNPSYPPTTALRVGAKLQLQLGYSDSSQVDSTVLTHSLYIDRIDQVNSNLPGQTLHYAAAPDAGNANTESDERAAVILHLSNRARHLERTVHTDKVHLGATLIFVAAEAATAGGIPTTPNSPGTTQFSQTLDTFTQAYPHTYRQVFDRIAQVYGFDWFVDENDALQLREPLAADAPAFTYGTGTVQTIGHNLAPVRTANHVRIHAKTTPGTPPQFADSFDFAAMQATGEAVHHRAADRLLSTSAQAHIRAGLDIRRAQRTAVNGWARLPLNPAHQPLDVITIADESLNAVARISSLEWLISMDTGLFEQLAQLEAP